MPADIPLRALCVGCNYPLRGLTEFRCPECGRPFDPDRSLTMNLGLPMPRVARAVLGPTGRWARVLVWSLFAAGVVVPGWVAPTDWLAILWLLMWGAMLVVLWSRSAMRWAVVRRYRQPPELLRADDRLRQQTRIAFVLGAFLVCTHAPFVLAVAVSGPWVKPYAQYLWMTHPSDVPVPSGPVVRGLVVVRRVEVRPSGATLELYGGGWIHYSRVDAERLRLDWSSWNTRGW